MKPYATLLFIADLESSSVESSYVLTDLIFCDV